MNWLAPITSVVDGIVSIFQTKQERKKLAEKAAAKLKQTKENNQHSVTLSDAEAEAILAEKTETTWKDEYSLVLVTFPIALIIAGTVYFVFSGDERLLQSGIDAIKSLEAAGVDMGFLMNAVILSSIGLKVWRKA